MRVCLLVDTHYQIRSDTGGYTRGLPRGAGSYNCFVCRVDFGLVHVYQCRQQPLPNCTSSCTQRKSSVRRLVCPPGPFRLELVHARARHGSLSPLPRIAVSRRKCRPSLAVNASVAVLPLIHGSVRVPVAPCPATRPDDVTIYTTTRIETTSSFKPVNTNSTHRIAKAQAKA